MPVWEELTDARDMELHILLTGMHAADGFAAAADVPDSAVVHRGGADLGGGTGVAGAARAGDSMASIARAAGSVVSAIQPDICLVTGDRLDMFPAAMATIPFNLPLGHLHGGEVTEGAIDDRLRHATTKLAHLHFVSSTDAAVRVNRLGEEAWRIHITGAPSLDHLRRQVILDEAEFAEKFGMVDTAGLRLVTVHPETNSAVPAAPLDAVLSALDTEPAPTLLTAPNSDPGGAAMRARLTTFAETRPWAVYRETLGAHLYANALHRAVMMIGNSSSGIIEAPLFGLPVVNVGGRQRGRLRTEIVDCAAETGAVVAAMRRAGATRRRVRHVSPYGDGHAAPRIAAVLADLPPREILLAKSEESAATSFEAPWDTPAAVPARLMESN